MEKINIIKKETEKEINLVGIGYDRISSPKFLEKKLSPEVQEQRIRDFCNFQKIKLLHVTIEVKTAKNIKGRLKFQEVLNDLRNGTANCLIVNDVSRAFRNLQEALSIMNELKEIGAYIFSISDNINTSTSNGRLIYGFLANIHEWQRNWTKDRVNEVIEYKIERGLNVGKIPFGYKFSGRGKPIKIDDKESGKIKDIFDLTIKGINYKEICKKYDLQFKSYYNIIRNQFYLGKIIYNGEIYQGIHEPIIDQEIFDNANSKIKTRKQP